MQFSEKRSDELLKPSEDMVFGLELRKFSSKRHSSLKTTKESSALPQTSRIPKDEDKLKLKSSIGAEHLDMRHKAKKDAEWKIENRGSFKRNATDSDELVKHMSNLPGYLLQPDRGHKSQEKAFNVGVLDWSRLEKWNHNHNHIPVLSSNFAAFSSSESSSRAVTKLSTRSVSFREKNDEKKGLASSSRTRPSKKNRECLPGNSKLLFPDGRQSGSSRSKTKCTDEKRMAPLAFESLSKTHSDVSLERRKRNDHSKRTLQDGNSTSNSRRHHGVSHVPKEISQQNTNSWQEYSRNKKERHHKLSSDIGQPAVISKNKEVSLRSKKVNSSSREIGKKVDQLQQSDSNNGHKHCHDFRLSELRSSSDEKRSESSQSSSSYVSLPEQVCAEDVCPEIPRSSTLSSGVEFTSLERVRRSIGASLDMDCSSVVSETPVYANRISKRRSLGAYSDADLFGTNQRNQSVLSNIKEPLNQESAELTSSSRRGRNISHSRRFSFSLSRIGRSFSFKEPPTLPRSSANYVGAKSGPVTPECSIRWDNPGKEKASSTRTNPSPLRRLLDPILRHKASSIHHSAESSQTQKGSMNSVSFAALRVDELQPSERSKGSMVRGLLQLTMKNGLPLFKFVLNNEKNIFAATRRSLSPLEKDDWDTYFTFYLVNEIKKKSVGWMSHGSKGKSSGYAYNCIAQMKFSSSKITKPIDQNSDRQRMVKEYVLIAQTEHGQPKLVQSSEIAAVVIETPWENTSNEAMHSDTDLLKHGCLRCLSNERCLCSSSGENDVCTTKVILPGGVHGSPNKGEPSPLIFRWRTGGSCDCGGWDIGCKLLVLSNQKQQSSDIPKFPKPFHDCFQLYAEEGDKQDTPIFTLSPVKDGFYSVEFHSSVTYLQAFFIAVAVLSCQKLPSFLEMGSMLEDNLKEPSSKNNNRPQGKAPLKYTPIPPLSPVGRV
ncbi:hypothetical protein HN51_022655 [Arachis hypogaea]|uniref:DUF3527 domain protein n=1 Tax=Arachis hypogaea TaxID=3818 RepID=A0A445EB51_ARAHY|nr:uncharacterized protein LOC112749009 [Arachis hypogaea]XP_025653058.1 uncharacterized protein LOC112749009 [Arachis hypogaea]QHO53955.1 uncharacterized protein DS421_2g52500 [Arachis hypogaea]RYR72763.1 hypothetical protein Ahy_A02g006977 isoform A [Arachis hypogaea]RYR72764.1 hypothetical protein Ahy_A02g006977 isoform B [Arachis hypogaea]